MNTIILMWNPAISSLGYREYKNFFRCPVELVEIASVSFKFFSASVFTDKRYGVCPVEIIKFGGSPASFQDKALDVSLIGDGHARGAGKTV